MADVLTSIALDARRPLKDGTYKCRLRITYKRERRYFTTKFSLSKEDFAKTQDPKPKGKFKEISIALQAIEQQAVAVINKLQYFSFEAFEKHYKKTALEDDVFAACDFAVERLTKEGQIGTAETYANTNTSLLSFMQKVPLSRNKGLSLIEAKTKKEILLQKRKPLPFPSVTPEFLKEYERWMLLCGKSKTTIGIYLRNLRALFNEAIASGNVHPDVYPFGRRKYQIPSGKNIKKALSKQEIARTFAYEPKHESEGRARDYWCFSYLCNGINIKDIARLRYRQLGPEFISFVRAKTERTMRHDQKTIKVPLLPQVNQIIERWGNKPALADFFVFPILEEGFTPEKELAVVKQVTKNINYYMKRIGSELGISTDVTTYTARHSFSTVLKRAGVSTAAISESLGHSSERTTQSYLDSFEDEVKHRIASHLTDF